MKFVPTAQDYLQHFNLPDWIHNGVKMIDNPESIEMADLFLQKLRKESEENFAS
jgi:hypothetical protein